jgi:hypothetical protein
MMQSKKCCCTFWVVYNYQLSSFSCYSFIFHTTSQHERILHLSCFRFNVHYHQLSMATCEVNHIFMTRSYHQSKSWRKIFASNWFPYTASRIISNCGEVHLGDNYLKAIFLSCIKRYTVHFIIMRCCTAKNHILVYLIS